MGTVLELFGFLGGSVVKNPPANAGDVGSTLGLGRFPWKEMAKSLEYSSLENSMDRGAWRAAVPGITKELNRRSHIKTKCARGRAHSFRAGSSVDLHPPSAGLQVKFRHPLDHGKSKRVPEKHLFLLY